MTRIGRFEVLAPLARGAHGAVYRARDVTGREVAIKVLLEHSDAEELLRFEREARLGSAVRHENVVATLEVGREASREFDGPYVVCELCTGGSLQQRLDQRGALEPAEALRIAIDVLRGLEAIHRAGLVHRDVKPANVLFDASGNAKLADLGLARRTAASRTVITMQGAILGTPAYIAPEQIERGERVDIRTDLYSTGVMLHQMLAGRLPFEARDVLELLRAHMQRAPAPLRVERRLAQVVARLMAKDPEQRPRDPSAALAELAPLAAELRAFEPASGNDDATLAPTMDERQPPLATVPPGGSDAATLEEAPAQAFELVDAQRGIVFVLAAPRISLGRTGSNDDPTHVCLRVLSKQRNESDSMRISNRHLFLRRDAQRWWALDDSSQGTTLNGMRMVRGAERELVDGSELELAGVLRLVARMVPPAIVDPSLPPSLVLERPHDGAHQRYLLLAAPLRLDLDRAPIALGTGAVLLDPRGPRVRWQPQPPDPRRMRPLSAADFKR